ncbi:ARM repeat-containing protein [Martensiomyces pterosporus]|nr:ARM repeat-containing protein [Martensiomyces pterosporus]
MSTQVSNEKPTLNGVRIRARKRDAKANAKYEPEDFRDNIFQVIEGIEPTDFSKISSALDTAGNSLDYRRYGDTFFEILVTGGIIAPGGIIEDDEEYGKLPFSLFVLAQGDDMLSGAQDWAKLISRLTRRYKYLERIFAESSKHILENIHRYSEEDNRRLSTGLGVLASIGFLPMDPLKVLQKDHLVKDGLALRFITDLLRVYLKDHTSKQLHNALVAAKIPYLIEFFPPNKRDDDCFARHFEAEDMPELIELHLASQANASRSEFAAAIERILRTAKANDEDEDEDDILAVNTEMARAAKQAMKTNGWSEDEAVVLVWDGILGAVDWAMKSEQVEIQALNQVKRYSPVLEVLTTTPKSEIKLLQHVQLYIYEDAKLMKYFSRIIQQLYQDDVLSDSAILFWAKKGVKPQGKAVFLKQTERLIKFLEEEGEDDDSDEDSE